MTGPLDRVEALERALAALERRVRALEPPSRLMAPPRLDQLEEAVDHKATRLVPKTTLLYSEGDVVRNTRTGESVLVQEAAVSALIVTRGIYSRPVGMLAGDELVIVGNRDSA